MPADTSGRPRASPPAGAPASASRTPSRPRSAAEHRKVGTRSGDGREARGGTNARGTQPPPGPQSSKPAMEKRRRARINESLAQLKTLILDALRKDVSLGEGRERGSAARGPEPGAPPGRPHQPRPQSPRHAKLEKADVLEMTVRHLRSLRRGRAAGEARGRRRGAAARPRPRAPTPVPCSPAAALGADPAVLGKYRAGFHECLAEVRRFLAGCEGVPADVRSRLLGHLAACLGQLRPLRRPAAPPPSAEAPAPEVHPGRPPPAAFDGPLALLRPGAAMALPFLPGLTGAPPAAPRPGPQGQGAPWRPWLR